MNNIRRYVGLSLSFCIRDILQGKTDVDEISAIVTSTKFATIESAFAHYYESYWAEYAEENKCMRVLKKVWPLVFQPRLNFEFTDHAGHMLTYGHWVDTISGNVTKVVGETKAQRLSEPGSF